MLDHSPVVLTDAEGVIRFWSAGAETAFGYAAIEAVGQTLDLIVPAEYSDAHWAGFRRAMAAGAAAAEGQISPFPVRRADGAVSPVPGRLTLIRRADGLTIGAMVAFG
jgi:PAS domain S-box-containing protein